MSKVGKRLQSFIDSRAFYELMQDYRHKPLTPAGDVVEAYEIVRAALMQSISDFCRSCGARIPPLIGEGTCEKCPKEFHAEK